MAARQLLIDSSAVYSGEFFAFTLVKSKKICVFLALRTLIKRAFDICSSKFDLISPFIILMIKIIDVSVRRFRYDSIWSLLKRSANDIYFGWFGLYLVFTIVLVIICCIEDSLLSVSITFFPHTLAPYSAMGDMYESCSRRYNLVDLASRVKRHATLFIFNNRLCTSVMCSLNFSLESKIIPRS